jgi:uncharacterized protein Smg (DUF494 family)
MSKYERTLACYMKHLQSMIKTMSDVGFSQDEIDFALKPLEQVAEALERLLTEADSTVFPLVFDLRKVAGKTD